MMNKLITVIISVYNRKEKLRLALDELLDQTLERNLFNVLVVDNNSIDNPEDVVNSFLPEMNIQYINEDRQGLGFVRDIGYKVAQSDYVVFIDDDAFPERNYLEIIYHIILNEEPDCICGPIFPYYDSPKPKWFKDSYEVRQYSTKKGYLKPLDVWSGSNMTWKKEVLNKLGGFNVQMGMTENKIVGGEDTDLFLRYWQKYNGPIVYDPEALVYHWVPEYKMKVTYRLKRSIAEGVTWAKVKPWNGFLDRLQKSIRMFLEIIVIAMITPLFIVKHAYIQQWLVEDVSRITVRLGRICGALNIPINLRF
jgi:glycosyltransferase involved in cell wall biosynthesis